MSAEGSGVRRYDLEPDGEYGVSGVFEPYEDGKWVKAEECLSAIRAANREHDERLLQLTDAERQVATLSAERDRLQAVVQEKNDALSKVWTERDALRAAMQAAITRLDDWGFPNSKPVVEDIADDLRAALRGEAT